MNKNNSIVVLSSLFAVSLILIIASPLSMVSASAYYDNEDGFLDIKKADIGIKDDIIKTIFFKTRGEIPTDGSSGAFGYGVVLSDGKAIVTTTHAGVLDSEAQQSILDPIFHNHFVQLAENTECVSDTAVGDLSFESPGEAKVQNNIALLKKLPTSAEGQFTGDTITPGSDVQVVASFKLQPLLDLTLENPLVAVCVEDIKPVDPRYVNIFEINRQYNNNDYMNNNPYYNNAENNNYDKEYYNYYKEKDQRY